MLRRDAAKSVSICDGFRKHNFFNLGKGLLPLLAVMLLASPQLAFAQDSLPVTVNPRSLDIDEDDNTGETYTVVLDAAPSDEVTITVVGGTDVVEVAPRELTFAPNDWQTPKPVQVTAPDDANAVDETVTLTHTATIGEDEDEVTLRNVSVTVRVKDDDTRAVTVTVTVTLNADGQLELDEAASGMYTVEMATQPTATVTVDVGGATGELAVSPSRLFFTPENYKTTQTVTVYAGEDFDAENDTATLTHTIRGGDYTGVSATPPTVSVMVDDDDERGVPVSTSSLMIAAGSTATYTVMLNTRPTSTVRISVAEDADNDNEGVRVSPSRLSFSTSSWNRPQTVTVRTNSDATESPWTIEQMRSKPRQASRDEGYDGVEVANVERDGPGEGQPNVWLSPSFPECRRRSQQDVYGETAYGPRGRGGGRVGLLEFGSGVECTLAAIQ